MSNNNNLYKKERSFVCRDLNRQLAISYLGGCCSVCGSTNQLHIHHINFDYKDNRMENLMLLCVTHHLKMHNKKHRDYSVNKPEKKPLSSDPIIFLKYLFIMPKSNLINDSGFFYKHKRDREHFRNYMRDYMRRRRAEAKQKKEEGVSVCKSPNEE